MPSTSHPSSNAPPVFRGLSLVAGHPALDLLNTVKYRGAADPKDRLNSFSDILDWALVAGLITETEFGRIENQETHPSLLGKVMVLRESLWRLLNQEHVDAKIYTQALEKIAKAVASLRPKIRIDPHSGVLHRSVAVQTQKDLVARIVDSIADLLVHRSELLIKTCDGCDCDWMFVDRTKARRRRWCDTRTCGNISRARDFRNKTKTA